MPNSLALRELDMKVEESNKITADALARLQTSFSSGPNDMGGPVSLASLASSLYRIEDLLGSVTSSLNGSGSLGSWGSNRSLGSNSMRPIHDGHRLYRREGPHGNTMSLEAERADRISRLLELEGVSPPPTTKPALEPPGFRYSGSRVLRGYVRGKFTLPTGPK